MTITATPSLALLENRARAEDREAFATLVAEIDWATRLPDELTRAIDLALKLELSTLAIALAQTGGRLFPAHERLQQAARVLAPPVVLRRYPDQPSGLRASRAWLREHAAAYGGLWVAVRDGQLLGAAGSLPELEAVIGEALDPRHTLVTRVL